MKERIEKHLSKARHSLDKARRTLDVDLADEAGRLAYIASFHAALAFISLRSDKSPKTHTGTRSVFAELARSEPAIDRLYATFLAESYKLKTWADYDTGEMVVVTLSEAQEAIDTAKDFVDLIAALVQKEHQE